ncbi:MAG: hypothetical protein HOA39_03680 [Gammaproteobacteria bacterium]|nr:hypothetical protein [Gammaproteobacteria bacterium]
MTHDPEIRSTKGDQRGNAQGDIHPTAATDCTGKHILHLSHPQQRESNGPILS